MSLHRKLEALAELGFEILPTVEIQTHFAISRDGFVALVERTPSGFGQIGSTGLLTERGFAALVWREDGPYFVQKELSLAASQEQVQSFRRFSADLRRALGEPA